MAIASSVHNGSAAVQVPGRRWIQSAGQWDRGDWPTPATARGLLTAPQGASISLRPCDQFASADRR
ncbi:MAG: hypothetical protein ACXWT3_01460 [Methylococcaceae bacterium]